ncbi:MAG: phenylalanine--tRNA ligase subunit alpha [Acidobacteriota bacterium]
MAEQEFSHPLWDSFRQDLEAASDLDSLTEVRDKYLSRHRGLLALEMRNLGRLPAPERPRMGQLLNQLKDRVTEQLESRQAELKGALEQSRMTSERVDVTLPGYANPVGSVHPIHRLWREMADIFVRMGFEVVVGPEVETDYYSFEALNIPQGHPARDDQDTFYLDHDLLLRPHTSPVQIRTMEARRPPLRIVVPGRVYRRDSVDATHSPMFHQVEGLVVDEGITLGDLKFHYCGGICFRESKRSGWVEDLCAGMVHPRVFEMVGYDPERYTGFAWGMGIDRIALFKYQIDDIRLLFENDLRFLRQF